MSAQVFFIFQMKGYIHNLVCLMYVTLHTGTWGALLKSSTCTSNRHYRKNGVIPMYFIKMLHLLLLVNHMTVVKVKLF